MRTQTGLTSKKESDSLNQKVSDKGTLNESSRTINPIQEKAVTLNIPNLIQRSQSVTEDLKEDLEALCE